MGSRQQNFGQGKQRATQESDNDDDPMGVYLFWENSVTRYGQGSRDEGERERILWVNDLIMHFKELFLTFINRLDERGNIWSSK